MHRFHYATEPATHVDVYCDTDFAGCTTTRRSTSGGCALIGGPLVKHWAKTQTTIALSSGEAKLGGLGSGMAQAIGLQSLAADMNWTLMPRVYSDATAAFGISKRRGLGKIRHLHCADLWVQEKTRERRCRSCEGGRCRQSWRRLHKIRGQGPNGEGTPKDAGRIPIRKSSIGPCCIGELLE